jgi:hypothetical protein
MLTENQELPGEGQSARDDQLFRAQSRQALIDEIKSLHRDHRFAVKQKSRIDRSLEAHIRVNVFGFSTFMDADERKKISKQALALIADCRNGKQTDDLLTTLVVTSDQSSLMWDAIEKDRRKLLEKAARKLPAHGFVKSVRGAGEHGFAQVIGEAGDLSLYANPSKLWKRLGLAPYQGLAMSSWMRKTWRPRALEKQEWIDNPFKPERYAIVAQIATHLCDHQVESKAKSGTKHGRPKGPYGEHYVRRREHTDITHSDWSDGHARADALRYTVKKFIRDLWVAWRQASLSMETSPPLPAADISPQGDGSAAIETAESTTQLPPPELSDLP